MTITETNDVNLDGSFHAGTISGNNKTRLFNVNAGVKFTLINLTLANGWHHGADGTANLSAEIGFGGGIYNNGGFVELVNCTLTNNVAYGGDSLTYGAGGPARGGAVFDSGGTLVLSNCTLSANRAEGGAGIYSDLGFLGDGGHAYGGAIFSSNSSVTLKETVLSDYRAVGGRHSWHWIGQSITVLPASTRLAFNTPSNQTYLVVASTNLLLWKTIGQIPVSG